MSHILFEIPAVIVILSFVCFVLIRAFTSPVPRTDERLDIFMKQHSAGNTSQPNSPNRSTLDREPSGSGGSPAQKGR
jgi:hypothetical protein